MPKTYRTTVDGNLHGEAMTTIENGLYLIDPKTGVGTKTARAHVKLIKRTRDRTVVDITIREGKNRQIRRMLAKVGHKVRDLIRTRMGPLELGELKPGQYRFLSPREVQALRKAVRPKPEKPGRGKAASNSPSSGESSKPAPTGRKPRPKPAAQAPRSHGPTPGARKPRLIIGPDADDTQ